MEAKEPERVIVDSMPDTVSEFRGAMLVGGIARRPRIGCKRFSAPEPRTGPSCPRCGRRGLSEGILASYPGVRVTKCNRCGWKHEETL
jgi:tRNA(Ile2) C34 agmatinyltransferase TiaS